MKLRLKLHIIFVLSAAFVLILSYKILELLLKGTDDLAINNNQIQHPNIDHVKHTLKKEQIANLKIVQDLIKKNIIKWDVKVTKTPWDIASEWVSPRHIIPEDAPELGAILKAMNTYRIVKADVGYRGTQLKLTLVLEGGQRVVFKPQWFERDFVILGKPYDGADRHNGEIATFHLARILGFYRTPIVVGRTINLRKEIMEVASQRLKDTFFTKDNNTCFYGKCLYCKGPETGVCAKGDLLEGAVVLWLPLSFKLRTYHHPWGRTYRDGKSAKWEVDETYCAKVVKSPLYSKGPLLLDIIDGVVLDYVSGNADRHHFEILDNQPIDMLLLMDNAKSFGNPYYDERSILAPLYQCCRIRRGTWTRLQILPGILGHVLEKVLQSEPLSPMLTWPHFKAIDRRLNTLILTVQQCITKYGATIVVIDE